MLNLNDKQKENYELINTTDINSNTNNIQCFFIERAKQLMAGGGVVGVIVPSSILSNADRTHIATREIILKYFDIVALVELGSGTFGKTGTNTVVLFLRRKDKQPEVAEHYQNRVEDYFTGDDSDEGEYQDGYLIEKYCQHNDLPSDEYKKLFGIRVDSISSIDELLKTEVFAEYKKDFANSTDIKNLKKKKSFIDKDQSEQQQELNKRLIEYLHAKEKDKLYYFMLAYETPAKVLIAKSPSDNKKQKQFLGYEWSSAKGSEGIKYNGGSTVGDIITPLFNPKDVTDKTKINHLIEQNFLGNQVDLSDFAEFQDIISYANVVDILDFSRVEFNKAFSLTPKKNIDIETKWELVKLGDVAEIQKGVTYPKHEEVTAATSNIILTADNISLEGLFEVKKRVYLSNSYEISDNQRLIANDIFMCFASGSLRHLGKVAYISQDTPYFAGGFMGIIRTQSTHPKYLYELLNHNLYRKIIRMEGTGSNIKNLSNSIGNIKIPLPPKDVQEQIVAECEAIDQAVATAQQTIDQTKKEIEAEFKSVFEKGYNQKTLEEVSQQMFAGGDAPKTNFSETKTEEYNIPIYANAIERKGLYGYTNQAKVFEPCITISARGTLGYTEVRREPFFPIVRLIVIIPNKFINVDYLKNVVRLLEFIDTGSTIPQLTVPKIKNLKIPVPPLAEQEALVAKIEKLEASISQAQQTMNQAPEQKNQILDTYLK